MGKVVPIEAYGTMSRAQAMRRLSVSWARLLAFENEGALQAQAFDCGMRYSITDVESLRARMRSAPPSIRKGRPRKEAAQPSAEPVERLERKGRLAAAVFDCFAKRMTLAQIVQESRVDPYTVRELWKEYNKPLEAEDSEKQEDARRRELEKSLRESRAREREEERRAYNERKMALAEKQLEVERMRLLRQPIIAADDQPAPVFRAFSRSAKKD